MLVVKHKGKAGELSHCRPITCLCIPLMRKLFTAGMLVDTIIIMKIFTERVYCQRNRKDVEETHEAKKISCFNCLRLKKGLGMVWMDYNKAYDNGTSQVLWIIECHRDMSGLQKT